MRAERAYRHFLRYRIVVSQVGRSDVRGVLWEARGPLLVLRNAEVLAPDATGNRPTPVPSDGEVIIERAHIDFIVAVPPAPVLA